MPKTKPDGLKLWDNWETLAGQHAIGYGAPSLPCVWCWQKVGILFQVNTPPPQRIVVLACCQAHADRAWAMKNKLEKYARTPAAGP
jgi:hypothetical protein